MGPFQPGHRTVRLVKIDQPLNEISVILAETLDLAAAFPIGAVKSRGLGIPEV